MMAWVLEVEVNSMSGLLIFLSVSLCVSTSLGVASRGAGMTDRGIILCPMYGAPACWHFSSEPTSTVVRLLPILPLAAALRIILPSELCAS